MLGVAVSTLRRRDKGGLLKPTFRTFGHRRRYAWLGLEKVIQNYLLPTFQ